MEPPMIIFFTSAACPHCIAFRGEDGKPSNNPDRPWNYHYIRELLSFPGSNFTKLRACCIMEIHCETMQNNIDNISEINFYELSPSLIQVNEQISKNSYNSNIIGSSIKRILIKRNGNLFDVNVFIDGVPSTKLSEIYRNYYVWGHMPDEMSEIRDLIIEAKNQGQNVDLHVVEALPNIDEEVRSFIRKSPSLLTNEKMFEQEIMSRFFGFQWVLHSILSPKIRDYEKYYPIWMLVLPSEYNASIAEQRAVYARVVNSVTKKQGNDFYTERFSVGETVGSLLDMYYEGDLKLKYESAMNSPSKRFSWQDR